MSENRDELEQESKVGSQGERPGLIIDEFVEWTPK